MVLLLASTVPGFGGAPQEASKPAAAMPVAMGGQDGLVDRAIAREKNVIKLVRERSPLVETYIQNMRPDTVMRQVPVSDQHFLGRVRFGRVIGDTPFDQGPKAGMKESKGSKFGGSMKAIWAFGGSPRMQFNETGFVQMALMDSNSFDRQHYNFTFVRNDFLGTIPTAVYDVNPLDKGAVGRFFGRVWIETQNGNVVRFNGDYSGSEKGFSEFLHFDSWRTNVQPDLWLPTSFYVEQIDPKSPTSTLKVKSVSHVWGYSLSGAKEGSENTSVEVAGAVDVSEDRPDVSPLAAQHQLVKQAEDNIVDRLYEAGLLDAPSAFDRTLEALVNNILAYNKIVVTTPVHVRTMLTEPLESLSVGNTIILSKSLIDTTAVITSDGAQQNGNLNALLAFQLAHILAGHHLDTQYAFNGRLAFPDTATFRRIPMHHSDADNAEAAKKAIELLGAKELVDSQRYFGLYLEQLQERLAGLKTLTEPLIGDGLVKSDKDSTFWMAALVPKGDHLDVKDLKQQGAAKLSSYLRFDPWTDQVLTMPTTFEPILSPSDKMPFEVAPVYIKLSYFTATDFGADPGPVATPKPKP